MMYMSINHFYNDVTWDNDYDVNGLDLWTS